MMGTKRKANIESKVSPTKLRRISRSKNYEDLCLKFSHIADSIFDSLDNQSLVQCKLVSRVWENFLASPKFMLMRKIQKTVETRCQFRKVWKSITKNVNTDTFSPNPISFKRK